MQMYYLYSVYSFKLLNFLFFTRCYIFVYFFSVSIDMKKKNEQ